MIAIKNLSRAADWMVWHRGLSGINYGITLNNDWAEFTNGAILTASPTSTTVTIKNPGYDGAATNNNGDSYVMYLWAHNNNDGEFGPTGDQDIIKCGSYTGNGSASGPDINLGFEPQWLLIKRRDSSSEDWFIQDILRGLPVTVSGINKETRSLRPNSTSTEADNGLDFHLKPNGFQATTSSSKMNGSGLNYIYIAIRRGPMAVPTSASDVFDIFEQTLGGGVGYSTVSATEPPFPIDFLLHKWHKSNREWDVMDRVRGSTAFSQTNGDNAEQNEPGWLDGIDRMQGLRTGSNGGVFYGTTDSIGYFWKRAPGYLDVVAYQGNSTAGRTINHNLNAVPEMIWVKARTGTEHWEVYHSALGNTQALRLNDSTAAYTGSWNNASPTSSVFTVSSSGGVNSSSHHYIAYLFATAAGVSKVGSYSGNGGTSANGNGQDIDCGFSNGARFVIIKPSNAGDHWFVYDTTRGIVAGSEPTLQLNLTSAQSATSDEIDPLNSGFRVLNQNNQLNRTGRNYIFYAIAA